LSPALDLGWALCMVRQATALKQRFCDTEIAPHSSKVCTSVVGVSILEEAFPCACLAHELWTNL
jgi:hypothetical protein